jgi:hypothetical protein
MSPDNLILSGNQDGIPTFPSVYGRVRSWLLQDKGSDHPELYHGLAIHKKVTNYPSENEYLQGVGNSNKEKALYLLINLH